MRAHLVGPTFGKHRKDGTKLFSGSDPEHASLVYLFTRLVHVGPCVAPTEQHHTVVANVDEVDEEAVKNLILYLLEEVRFLLNELVHYLIEKVERVWLEARRRNLF